MTAFIILISFMLNLVSILAIVVLYLRQNKLIKLEKTQKGALKEIEDTLSAYLFEMKAENEQLLSKIAEKSNIKNTAQTVSVSEEDFVKSTSLQKSENGEKVNNKPFNRSKQKAAAAYKAPLYHTDDFPDLLMNQQDKVELTTTNQIESMADKQEQSDFNDALLEQIRYPKPTNSRTISDEIMSLYQNGYSIEEIAKKLHKGKTEVQLIVKLNK